MTKRWTSAQHDEQVVLLLNRFIGEQYGPKKTLLENLTDAHGSLVSARHADQGLEWYRDADYYFWGRCLCAGRKDYFTKIVWGGAGYSALELIYNPAKVVAVGIDGCLGTKLEKNHLRSDKNNPNASPGGGLWYKRGAYDGFLDNGRIVAKPSIPNSWPSYLMGGHETAYYLGERIALARGK
jgi:hypothetical protein